VESVLCLDVALLGVFGPVFPAVVEIGVKLAIARPRLQREAALQRAVYGLVDHGAHGRVVAVHVSGLLDQPQVITFVAVVVIRTRAAAGNASSPPPKARGLRGCVIAPQAVIQPLDRVGARAAGTHQSRKFSKEANRTLPPPPVADVSCWASQVC